MHSFSDWIGRGLPHLLRDLARRIPPSEPEALEPEIAFTGQEIDELVYELFGITDEERKIIEGG